MEGTPQDLCGPPNHSPVAVDVQEGIREMTFTN